MSEGNDTPLGPRLGSAYGMRPPWWFLLRHMGLRWFLSRPFDPTWRLAVWRRLPWVRPKLLARDLAYFEQRLHEVRIERDEAEADASQGREYAARLLNAIAHDVEPDVEDAKHDLAFWVTP